MEILLSDRWGGGGKAGKANQVTFIVTGIPDTRLKTDTVPCQGGALRSLHRTFFLPPRSLNPESQCGLKWPPAPRPLPSAEGGDRPSWTSSHRHRELLPADRRKDKFQIPLPFYSPSSFQCVQNVVTGTEGKITAFLNSIWPKSVIIYETMLLSLRATKAFKNYFGTKSKD